MSKVNRINIQGINDIDDPFYRYTMVKLNVVKLRNKIMIDNLNDVAKDLERDPKLIVDYFKKKLNVAIVYKNNLLSMSANLQYEIFELALREFIEIYVLCDKCKLPETILTVNKTKIMLDCKCCAQQTIKLVK